jgi:NAD(P)-dependent dehydrogenase (short-subunit alcohol dehydrogenase family)
MSDRLAGETALVTGGARRIGEAIAIELADAGADVIVHYNTSQAEAEATARCIAKLGAEAATVQADLGQPGIAESLIDEAGTTLATPSLLVNNASVFPQADLHEAKRSELEEAIAVNAWAPIALTRELATRSDEAAVVNLVDARTGAADRERLAYALSKDALASATRMLARQLAPAIRVNAVAPGPILPPSEGETDGFDDIAEATPLSRAGSVEEVAQAVRDLLAATYTTGAVVPVDGGQRLNGGPKDG